MKKVLITIITVFAFVYGYAQITVTIGSALLQAPGTDIHLPLTVKGLDETNGGTAVSGIELHVAYTNTSLVYDTTINFSSLTPTSQWFFGANDVEYSTNWLEPTSNKLNIPDNTVLFDVVFHYLGGSTELVFDTIRSLLIDGSFNIISGVHFLNGVVTPSQGSTESRWNGTGSWNTIANWTNGIPGDSTNAIIETGVIGIKSNAVCKSLIINPGSTLNVTPEFSLSVNKNFTNSGAFNLQSDATGTGSLIVRGSISGSGTNSFFKYVDFHANSLDELSSPVTGTTASAFGGNPAEKYVESQATWVALQASDILGTAVGSRISGTSTRTFTFQGVFTSSDVNRNDLSYTSGLQVNNRGFNLLGNPYPSAIQWEQGNWQKTGLDYSVYVWNGYKYLSWNGSFGALKAGIIPAMKGFFIKANTGGASITIPAGSRLHSSQPFIKESAELTDMISLNIENVADSVHFDETFVQILDASTTGYDGNVDAWKLFGNPVYPQIYTKASDQSLLSINTQPAFTAVPVEYTTGAAGSYRIIFGNIESFNPNQPLFFEDKSTSTVINVRNSKEYVFVSDGTTVSGRFVLYFQEVGINDQNNNNGFLVWNNGKTFHISSKTGRSSVDQVQIYNLVGQNVASFGFMDLPATLIQENLINGVYIIRIKAGDEYSTQKLVVK